MEAVMLGGRNFQVIANGPIKHDIWMQRQVHAAGLDNVHVADDGTSAELVDAMLDRLMESGSALTLLGGMLAPAELDLREWTPSVAADATLHIERLMGPEDKAIVRGMIAQVLIGFFQSGLASLRTSRTSSRRHVAASEQGEPPQMALPDQDTDPNQGGE